MRTALVLALALLADAPALACGGFFCNNQNPIDQSAERIVFGVDPTGGTVDMNVQITYSGASDHFAWVVPTPQLPDLYVSTDALFSFLDAYTQPTFYLDYTDNSWCRNDYRLAEGDYDAAGYPSAVDDSTNGVQVISRQTVGPYETVILQANSADQLITWLQGDGYQLPDDLDPVLAPYVAAGQYFVALKLSAGNDTGDLRPLGLRYHGTAAAIPVQLTSIAAQPNMRLEVYILGQARAVPDNYLHVTINEAAIDWFTYGSNYDDTITQAADEAGGHAFATDFSGSTGPMQNQLYSEGRFNLAPLRTMTDPGQWTQELISQGFPGSSEMLALLEEFIPEPAAAVRDGITEQQYYNCVSCYAEYGYPPFDAQAATDAVDARILQPLRAANQLLLDYPHITRLTSSLDAVEMTVDPNFVFNSDLPQDMTNQHHATLEVNCGIDGDYNSARRQLTLTDGREIDLPSVDWLSHHSMTELDYMSDLASPKAILIEDYSATGLGEVIFDWRKQASDAARAFPGGGCGCDSATSGGGALVGLLGLLVSRRRKK